MTVRLLCSATVKNCWHVHSSGPGGWAMLSGISCGGIKTQESHSNWRITIGWSVLKIFMLLVISQRWMQVMANLIRCLLQLPCSRENFFASNLNLSSNEKWKAFRYFDKGTMATIEEAGQWQDLKFLHLKGFFAWISGYLFTWCCSWFRDRLVVLINWIWNYFSYDRAIRLIIRPYKKNPEAIFFHCSAILPSLYWSYKSKFLNYFPPSESCLVIRYYLDFSWFKIHQDNHHAVRQYFRENNVQRFPRRRCVSIPVSIVSFNNLSVFGTRSVQRE